jgi:hypothetical protein
MTIHPGDTAPVRPSPMDPPPSLDQQLDRPPSLDREFDDAAAEAAQTAIAGLAGAAETLVAELRDNPAYGVADLLRALATTAAATAVLLEANEAYTADVSPEAVRPVRRARMLSWQAQRCLDTACHRAALAPPLG